MIPVQLYTLNIVLSLATVFLLALAIAADWRQIRPMWKPFLVAVTAEQCVIAYANQEAAAANVAVDTRLVLLFLSLLSLVITVALILLVALTSRHRMPHGVRSTHDRPDHRG